MGSYAVLTLSFDVRTNSRLIAVMSTEKGKGIEHECNP